MAEMTGGRYIAESLHQHGVDHVFFMPFIGTRALMEMHALGIRRIQPHGEKAAAYMADAYARVSGRIGVCMAQSVGAMNLAAGLQDAYLANSPVVAITGREEQRVQQRHAYQEVEHAAPFSAVTKYSALVPTAASLPVYWRQALRSATTGTPGPVHLDFEGFFGQAVIDRPADLTVTVEPEFSSVPAFRPIADDASIERVLAELGRAERPVIVAGGGVLASGARDELIATAERLQIPVAIALEAKMAFPGNHPLTLGAVGTYSRECANRAVGEADLVFYVGCHAGTHSSVGFLVPPEGTPTVQLDIDPAEIGRNYPLRAGMQGDVRDSLRRLLELAEPVAERTAWIERVQGLVATWKDDTRAVRESDDVPMRPERLAALLSEQLPDDVVLISDTSHAGIWTGTMLDLDEPTQSYYPCAGSLGWALPASLGAKCAAPDRPVVTFTGDGGIWYHLAELETAVRCGINTVTVVNNNHSLNQEKNPVEMLAGGRSDASDELWLFDDVDFAAIAESMGVLGLTVHQPGEFASALDKGLAADRPVLIDVKTDVDAIAPPAWRG